MSLGAVCLFVWAVLSGMFNDVEQIKYKAAARRSTTMSATRRSLSPWPSDDVQGYGGGCPGPPRTGRPRLLIVT